MHIPIESSREAKINTRERKPREILKSLYRILPNVARELISGDWYENPQDPYREEFLKDPNNPLMQ